MKLARLVLFAFAGLLNLHGGTITGLCNTGVIGPCAAPTGAGSGLAPVGPELNWTGVGFTAEVPDSIWLPVPPWVANGPDSQWISTTPFTFPVDNTNVFTLSFFIDYDVTLSAISIIGRYLSDNGTTSVLLNGAPVPGFPFNALDSVTSMDTWTNFTLAGAGLFQHGPNTLDWTVTNFAAETGLRVEFLAVNTSQVPEPAPLLLGGLGLVAAGLFRRRRP